MVLVRIQLHDTFSELFGFIVNGGDPFLRPNTDDERKQYYDLIDWADKESSYPAKMILLKDECYAVPEIKIATNHHDTNIRYWYIVSLRKRWNKSYSGKYIQASKDSRGD